MYDEIIEDQRNSLPSETEKYISSTPAQHFPSYAEAAAGRIVKKNNPESDEDWDRLVQKSMDVYADGLSEEMDFKHRKATADTVMEIRGYKGNKKDDGPVGPTFVLGADAAEKLMQGLSGLASMTNKELKDADDVHTTILTDGDQR